MIFSQILSKILRSKATTPTKYILPLFSVGFLVWILALLLTSCSSIQRVQTVPLETVCDHQVHDTIFLHNVQNDSVYVASDHYVDRSRDTILIKDKQIEYRYRLLRDTIFVKQIEVQRDSIPYEVRITEAKEVNHIPPWFKLLALIGFITILVILIFTFTKLKRF